MQRMALFVACLCHDLDHRGKNNFFLSKSGSPLANLYSDPIIENHHFSQTVALLQIESLSIFSHFSDEEYFQVSTYSLSPRALSPSLLIDHCAQY